MWPKLSNINKDIHDKITNRNNLEASKLNCWVRLFSGVGDGLIMVSNPDTQLFAAAGEGGIYGFAGAGEEAGYSGTLGSTWGKIEAGKFKPGESISAAGGRSLRPSPMVTSLQFSEGEDQISRSGKISLTVFSLEQMEFIQEYFMEPGYNLFIEWGWNTTEGASGLIKTDDPNKIPSLAAAGNLVQSAIRKKGIDSNGDYDNMMGFIVGAVVGNDGENFSVEIELRGTPELPSYLQSQNVAYTTLKNGGGVVSKEGSSPYPAGVLTDTGDTPGAKALDRRFATMFNSLPSHRQTQDVVDLKQKFTIYDFVNCDGLITENINNYIQGSFWANLRKAITPGSDVDSVKVQNFQVEKEKLFSKKKYIRLERAIEIIGASGLSSYISGDKTVSCNIDIKNTKIGAFPLIFSTKPESLLIPGNLPNFQKYYLATSKPNYKDIQGEIAHNSIKGISFVQNTPSTKGHIEAKNYWGYLKNLYINQDMMVSRMVSKNKNIREILYDILNELSSAVNSFWDFQIVEGEDVNGNVVLTVIDRNWAGKSPGTPKEFYHNGEKSRFINSSLSIDIPGEMTSQIISQRLGASVKTDGVNVETGDSRFFAKSVDKFMNSLKINGNTTKGDESESDLRSIEAQEKAISDNEAAIKDITAGGTEKYVRVPGSDKFTPAIYNITNEFGVELYTKTVIGGRDIITYAQTTEGQELKRLNEANDPLKNKVNSTQESNLSTNIDKLDVVPNPESVTSIEDILTDDLMKKKEKNPKDTSDKEEEVTEKFKENFKIYTFKDTNLLDIIKNNSLLGKNTGRLSQPLPIKYSFTILGTSGIRRGDMFNIVGIPEKYRKYGLFQVNAVEHSIEGMKWQTTIEGLYRQTQ